MSDISEISAGMYGALAWMEKVFLVRRTQAGRAILG